MWFLFGLISLMAGFAISLRARTQAGWKGLQSYEFGYPFLYDEARHKDKLVLVRIGLSAPRGFHFCARAERFYDKLWKWIGITVEMQMRAPEFDRTVYLEADAKGVGELLSERLELRQALLEILGYARKQRFRRLRVRCAYGRLWIEFRPRKENDLFAAKRTLAPILKRLADGLQASKIRIPLLRDPFVWRAAALLSVSTATMILGCYGLMRSIGRTDILDAWQLFLASMVPGVLAAGVFLMIVLAVLGRSSRAHLVLVEAMLVGGLGFVLSAYALARDANVDFDFSSARPYVLHGVQPEHRISYGRRGRKRHHYYLHVAGWGVDRDWPLKLSITRAEYYALEGQGSAIVYVRPGALGFEWVERVAPTQF